MLRTSVLISKKLSLKSHNNNNQAGMKNTEGQKTESNDKVAST